MGDAQPTGDDPTPDASTSGGDTPTTGAIGTTSSGDTSTGADVSSDDGDESNGDESSGGGGEIFNCDVWEQDCPDGFKCMAYTDEGDYFTGTKCTPVAENGGVAGDTCYAEGGWSTGVDDCALGFACWNINPETSIGGCVAQCTGTMDAYSCPEEGDICVFWVPGLAHVCLEQCDPMLQDCPVGQGCGPNWASGGQEFVCILDWSFDEGQEFDPCTSGNSCDPGLICWYPTEAVECDQDAAGCCLSFCDLTDPSCEGENSVCEPFYAEGTAPPEHANLGICGLPG